MSAKKKLQKRKRSKSLQRLLSFCKPYRGKLYAAMIFAFLYVALSLTAPVLLGYAIDKAVGKGMVDFAGIAVLLIMGCIGAVLGVS